MLAGSICQDTDCTGLILFVLALLAGAVIVVLAVAVAWGFAASAMLRRTGCRTVVRRLIVCLVVAAGLAAPLAALEVGGSAAGLYLWLVALPSIPVAVWQRRETRRNGASDQSRPCSTA